MEVTFYDKEIYISELSLFTVEESVKKRKEISYDFCRKRPKTYNQGGGKIALRLKKL